MYNWKRFVMGCGVVLMGLGVGASLAQRAEPREAPMRGESREKHTSVTKRLKPAYERLRTRQQFTQLSRSLAGQLYDEEVVNRYLAYLPMSPLEVVKLEMERRRQEFAIPSLIGEWHNRWVAMHETTAREQYGDRYVDQRLFPSRNRGRQGAGSVHQKSATSGDNRNVGGSGPNTAEEYQGETQVAVNPNDTTEIVIAANTSDSMGGTCGDMGLQAIFHSSDAGQTWSYTCPPDATDYNLTFFNGQTCAAAGGATFGSDPALSWDDSGNVFLEYMLLCFDGTWFDGRTVVSRSSNGGATWSAHGVVSQGFVDKNFYTVDKHQGSPYYERHYSCFKDMYADDGRAAWSADGGQTWSVVDTPEVPGAQIGDYSCDIETAADGTVHLAVWGFCYNGCYGPQVYHMRSSDGGQTWSTPTTAFDLVTTALVAPIAAQDNRQINFFGALATDRSGGSCDGNLYATFTDVTGGVFEDADVFVIRSTNGGASWSAPLKLNDDGLVRAQFHPTIAADPTDGRVVVAWHDTRNDPNNREVDVYAAVSQDCGVTFGANQRITQPSAAFNNSAVATSNENSVDNPQASPNQYGDYMSVDLYNGIAYVAWPDSRQFYPGFTNDSQKENIGFAAVNLGAVSSPVCGDGQIDPPEVCDGLNLAGQTCASQGFASGTLACDGACGAFDTSDCQSAPQFMTLTSIASEDGWVRERNENANTGRTVNTANRGRRALRIGDDRRDRQIKSVVSFDTSQIPPGATIQSVELRLQRGGVTGADPFATHGVALVDVNSGGLGGSAALQSADFQAAASAPAAATLSASPGNNTWSTAWLNAAGIAAINRNGRTQIRLSFSTDDNDNATDDYVGFYSSDNSNASRHPQLIVTYTF